MKTTHNIIACKWLWPACDVWHDLCPVAGPLACVLGISTISSALEKNSYLQQQVPLFKSIVNSTTCTMERICLGVLALQWSRTSILAEIWDSNTWSSDWWWAFAVGVLSPVWLFCWLNKHIYLKIDHFLSYWKLSPAGSSSNWTAFLLSKLAVFLLSIGQRDSHVLEAKPILSHTGQCFVCLGL